MDARTLAAEIYSNPLVRIVVVLILANLALGVAVSIWTKTFYLGDIGNWLYSRAIPYLLGAGAWQLVLMNLPQEYTTYASIGAYVGWGTAIVALFGKLIDSSRVIWPNIPDFLGSKPKPDVKANP